MNRAHCVWFVQRGVRGGMQADTLRTNKSFLRGQVRVICSRRIFIEFPLRSSQVTSFCGPSIMSPYIAVAALRNVSSKDETRPLGQVVRLRWVPRDVLQKARRRRAKWRGPGKKRLRERELGRGSVSPPRRVNSCGCYPATW